MKTLTQFIIEFNNIFNEKSDKIQKLDKEGCSNDERIFDDGFEFIITR